MLRYEESLDLLDDLVLYYLDGSHKEIYGKFCNARINHDSVPPGIYAYDFRGGDDEYLCSLEPLVIVNHSGTFICNEAIDFGVKNRLILVNENESNMDSADLDHSFF